jgi:hypothetical protein
MALGSTQPVTEMSTRSKGRPARNVDNLTATCETSRKFGNLDVSQPYGPLRLVTRIALLIPERGLHNRRASTIGKIFSV